MRNLALRNLLRRRVLAALVLGAAVLGGTIVYAQASKVTTTYRTALVTYGTITQSIGMAGNLTPVNEADLNFASAGTVQNLYVQVGQTVGAGTPWPRSTRPCSPLSSCKRRPRCPAPRP